MAKILIAASAAALIAVPAAADAQGYPYPYYGDGYNGQTYYGNNCTGTTGTIVGGLAGAYVGSRVVGSRQRYDYYGNRRGGSNTTGALIGGAVGALLGRSVDKKACERRNGYNGYNNYGYRY
jgi:uncharacterized membrane protein YfcA